MPRGNDRAGVAERAAPQHAAGARGPFAAALANILKTLVATLVTTAKLAVLFVVFLRFHASWVGLSVVLGMAILLFRLDRAAVRWAANLTGLRR
ncbi:MAG: hypothetical protein NVSMB19_26770 [Vulcanimicrobiaceae bacterium]